MRSLAATFAIKISGFLIENVCRKSLNDKSLFDVRSVTTQNKHLVEYAIDGALAFDHKFLF